DTKTGKPSSRRAEWMLSRMRGLVCSVIGGRATTTLFLLPCADGFGLGVFFDGAVGLEEVNSVEPDAARRLDDLVLLHGLDDRPDLRERQVAPAEAQRVDGVRELRRAVEERAIRETQRAPRVLHLLVRDLAALDRLELLEAEVARLLEVLALDPRLDVEEAL